MEIPARGTTFIKITFGGLSVEKSLISSSKYPVGIRMRGDQLLNLREDDKLNYLIEKLGVPQNLIYETRKIDDRRERLLRAMRISAKYENKPRRAIALMLAGYSGVSVIEHYFGSYHNLRQQAGLYSGNAGSCQWPEVDFSQADLRRNIRIPETITEDVAELIGIHIGDGHQHTLNDSYVIEVTCNHNERLYIDHHVIPLYEKVYGLRPKPNRIKEGAYGFRIKSKAIFTFQRSLGLPEGRKTAVAIPNIIMGSRELKIAYLRGIADTDFGITRGKGGGSRYHPIIIANFSSRALVEQIEMILKDLGFRVATVYDYRNGKYRSHSLRIHGFNNLHRWVELIGFNNPKHHIKCLFWRNLEFARTKS